MEELSMEDIMQNAEAKALEQFKLNRMDYCSRIGFNPNKEYQPFCTYLGCTLYPTDMANTCKSGCSNCPGFLSLYSQPEKCISETVNIDIATEDPKPDLDDRETLHSIYTNQFYKEDDWNFSYSNKESFEELEYDYPVYTKINSLIAALKLSGNKYADKLNYITLTEMRKERGS